MSKRKRKSNSLEDAESNGQKRPYQSSAFTSQSISYGRVDPTYGQRSAIPGLDEYSNAVGDQVEDADSDLEYFVDVEALDYLRSVRVEARAIPTLLVAGDSGVNNSDSADRSIYENGVGDSRGWYQDGAYIAAPAEMSSPASDADAGSSIGKDPQSACYDALLARSSALRHQLAQVPPRYAVERLDVNHGSYMSGSVKDIGLWKWRLGNTDPAMAQLAGMDKGTAMRLLRMMGNGNGKGWFLGAEDTEGVKRTSAWVWGLLAKMPERGELLCEEVGVIRELGKRAVWVGVEMKGVDMGSLREHMEDSEEEGDGHGGDGDILDAEINRGDVDLDFEGAKRDECFTNGNNMDGQNLRHFDSVSTSYAGLRDSDLLSDLDPAPIIGPVLPEPQPGQPPRQFNTAGTINENPPPLPPEAILEGRSEAETLSVARARLLARIHLDVLPPSPSDTQPAKNLGDNQRPHAKKPTGNTEENGDGAAASAELEDGEWDEGEDIDAAGAADVAAEVDWDDGEGEEDEAGGRVKERGGEEALKEDEGEVEVKRDDGKGPEGERGMSTITTTTPTTARQATKALIDMIITIVGEAYGQRDLLEFREVWG